MITHFKTTAALLDRTRDDLLRRHEFACERVGFITCRFGLSRRGETLVLAHDYYPVSDDHYIDDARYGALIDSNAFRSAMQLAYQQGVGIFHVHLHDHIGVPKPSRIDLHETAAFVLDFFNVQPRLPHGALILSTDEISGRIWSPKQRVPRPIDRINVVGCPMQLAVGHRHG